MAVVYDPRKRAEALAYRGLDFARADEVFADLHFTVEDARRDYGEPRFQTVGRLDGRVIMVVWTPRDGARRVISMRRCHADVRDEYERRCLGRPG